MPRGRLDDAVAEGRLIRLRPVAEPVAAAPQDRRVVAAETDPGRPLTAAEARHLGRVRRIVAEHPVVADVAVCLVAAASLLAFAVPDLVGHWAGDARQWVGLAGMLAAGGGLALRRRQPLATLVIVTAGSVAGSAGQWPVVAAVPAVGAAVYAVAAARPARVAWAALAGALVALLAGSLAWPTAQQTGPGWTVSRWGPIPIGVAGGGTAPPGDPSTGGAATGTLDLAVLGPLSVRDLLTWIAMAMAGVVCLAAGASVRARRERVDALVQRSAARVLAAEQRARLTSAEERAVVAREMHDVVAHSLSVMIALADGARASLDRDPASARDALDGLAERGRTALADMRRVVGALREEHPPTAPQPTAQDLEALVAGFRDAGLPVRVLRTGPDLPDELGLTVFRIVQESLTNVLRHAPDAHEVDVDIHVDTDVSCVTVTDDGGHVTRPVQRPAATAGRGLVGMRERVALHQGTLSAGPSGHGWQVRATFDTTRSDT